MQSITIHWSPGSISLLWALGRFHRGWEGAASNCNAEVGFDGSWRGKDAGGVDLFVVGIVEDFEFFEFFVLGVAG